VSDRSPLIDPVRRFLSAPRCTVLSTLGPDGALAQAMRQAERYGEDPADFAGQPRVSFRVDPEHVHEYS
jgi:hypothetical protein